MNSSSRRFLIPVPGDSAASAPVERPGLPTTLGDGRRDMGIGAALCAGGILITAVTYSLASDQGGTFLILWGPVVFGAIRFVKGMVRYLSSV